MGKRGKERGKVLYIGGLPTVPYGVDVASGAGGVVGRGQMHGTEDLG